MRDIIIALICKNESQYLTEFIDYHFSIGFDKVIIADNNDVDGERYDDILADYIKDGKVVILDYRGKKCVQNAFYTYICKDRPFEYEWCAFIDTDEFITFNKDSKYHNIKDFLKDSGDVKAYKINWMVYGDNGCIKNDKSPVLERFISPKEKDFKYHYSFPENYHIKSLLHGDIKGEFKNPHYLSTCGIYHCPNGGKSNTSPFQEIEWSVMYIRHFFTKSLQEFINRRFEKGYADGNSYRTTVSDYFRYNEITNEKIRFLYEFFNYQQLSEGEKRKLEKQGVPYKE